MSQSSPQRKFTAEIRRPGVRPQEESAVRDRPPGSGGATTSADVAVWQLEVLEAIADVRRQIAEMREGSQPPASPAAAAAPSAPPSVAPAATDPLETAALREELHALELAINETKREIAALRQMGKPPAHLATATNELDAVVQATEGATECILAASERIDELVGRLRVQSAGGEETTCIDEIGEQVTRIFEACNFQDITGQRINKVVNAMKFIEERVERMITILGGAHAIAEVAHEIQEAVAEDDESHLLCGPQLEQSALKVSQDDIDRFFD